MTFDQLCSAARSKYNNMEASDEYSKVDPKDATIMALTSRLEIMEKSNTTKAALATTGGGRGGPGGGSTGGGTGSGKVTKNNPTGDWTGGVATWRTIKKGPTATAPDDSTVWWCPNHKQSLKITIVWKLLLGRGRGNRPVPLALGTLLVQMLPNQDWRSS